MALGAAIWPVLEGGARMEQLVVVQDLDVPCQGQKGGSRRKGRGCGVKEERWGRGGGEGGSEHACALDWAEFP